MRTYLDWNASAPLGSHARDAMLSALDLVGNPSSVHGEGRRLRGIVETAREQVAALVGARPADVVFTSGASEANAWAVSGGWDTIFLAGIEHDSVRIPAARSGARIVDLAVAPDGCVQADALPNAVQRAVGPLGRALVALQLANNETGIVQRVAETAAACRSHGFRLHCDAVQAAGRIGIDIGSLGADFVSLSAHKLGGPKGVGALILRDGAALPALIAGGGQERRRRAGTENVAAIAGFGAAAAAAKRDLADIGRIGALRDELEAAMIRTTPAAVVVGVNTERLANTSCIAVPGHSAETLVIRLDLAGIAVSAGAACSSGKVGVSAVLSAMGVAPDIARGAIRVSLGHTTTPTDIAAFLAAWTTIFGRHARAA